VGLVPYASRIANGIIKLIRGRDGEWEHIPLTVKSKRYETRRDLLRSCATSIPFTQQAIPLMGTKLRTILPCALGRIPKRCDREVVPPHQLPYICRSSSAEPRHCSKHRRRGSRVHQETRIPVCECPSENFKITLPTVWDGQCVNVPNAFLWNIKPLFQRHGTLSLEPDSSYVPVHSSRGVAVGGPLLSG